MEGIMNVSRHDRGINPFGYFSEQTKDWYIVPQSNKVSMIGRIVSPNSLKAYSARTGTSG